MLEIGGNCRHQASQPPLAAILEPVHDAAGGTLKMKTGAGAGEMHKAPPAFAAAFHCIQARFTAAAAGKSPDRAQGSGAGGAEPGAWLPAVNAHEREQQRQKCVEPARLRYCYGNFAIIHGGRFSFRIASGASA